MKHSLLLLFLACVMLLGFAAQPHGQAPSQPPEALTGFDNLSNAIVDDQTHQLDQANFERFQAISDGLGPLYTRNNCGACHQNASRGPGLVRKFVFVESDGVTPRADQSAIKWGHTEHPLVTAGAKTPVLAPHLPGIKVTTRVGPPALALRL